MIYAAAVIVVLLSCVEGRVGEEKLKNKPDKKVAPKDGVGREHEVMEEELLDYVVGFKQPNSDSVSQQEVVQAMSTTFDMLSGPLEIHTMIPMIATAGVKLSARVSILMCNHWFRKVKRRDLTLPIVLFSA